MISRGSPLAALVILTASCSCGASSPPIEPSATVAAAPSTPAFEVHEWGLVRGTAADTIMISGPHAPEPPMVVTKPVLYFHREAERGGLEALIVDVDARIPDGRIVEHWPTMGGDPGSVASWHGVVIQSGSCPGSRYPSLAEDPLFGSGIVASGVTTRLVVTTTPIAPPPPTTEVLYILPLGAADAIAELSITPPPTVIRRAIVMWLDETSGP